MSLNLKGNDLKGIKTILVTGGAGFIGSNLSADLLSQGSVLTLVDNLERGQVSFIQDILEEVVFIVEDLRNEQFCIDVCKDMDIVIHLASKVGGIGYFDRLQAASENRCQTLENSGARWGQSQIAGPYSDFRSLFLF